MRVISIYSNCIKSYVFYKNNCWGEYRQSYQSLKRRSPPNYTIKVYYTKCLFRRIHIGLGMLLYILIIIKCIYTCIIMHNKCIIGIYNAYLYIVLVQIKEQASVSALAYKSHTINLILIHLHYMK